MIKSSSNRHFHLFLTLLNVVVVIGTTTVDYSADPSPCRCKPNCTCSLPIYNKYCETTCCIDCKTVSPSTKALDERKNALNSTCEDDVRNGRSMPLADIRSGLDCAVKLRRVCENDNITLACPRGKIKILSANYGRTEKDVCGYSALTNCSSEDSISMVSCLCEGESTCSIHASNDVFGDPCVGTFKYLDVSFQCPTNEGAVISSGLSIPEAKSGVDAIAYSVTREIMAINNPSTPAQKDVRRGQLEQLANATIPPGQALHATAKVSNLTSNADTFEESDVSLSIDIVDNILESLENGTGVAVAHGVLQTVDNLLSVDGDVLLVSQGNHDSTTRILKSVERLSQLIDPENGSVTIETEKIVLTVEKVNVTGFKGLSFNLSTSSQSKMSNGSSDSTGDMGASIELPASLFESVDDSDKSQVGNAQFIVYKSNKFFKVLDNRDMSDLVIAASIEALKIMNLREPVMIKLAKNASYRTINESCVFWDYNLNGKNGAWSSEGCTVSPEENDNNSVLCECNHLTNFALLVDIYNGGINIDSPNQKVLSIISNVGCTVSLFALAVAIVSLIAYKKKKDKDKVTMLLLNLCLALFMAYLMFLIGSFSTDFAPIIPELCITVAVVLHYFLLSVLAWMALQAVQLYLLFVKVFKTYIRRFMVKFCLLGWGVPLIFVIVTMAIDLNNYGYHNGICWLSRYPFYGAFLAPLCFVLIFNSVIYCLVINQLCRLDTRAMATNERYGYLAQLRAAIGLMVLLGLTWVFAFFAIGQASLVFNYLFAIFNSLQGLFIFVFHCAMKKEIQKGWRKTFCRCRRHKYRFVGTAVEERGDKNEQAMSTFKEYAYTDTSTEQKGHSNEQTMSTFDECTDVDTPMDHKDHDYEPEIPPTFKEYRYEKSMPNFKEYTYVQTMSIQYVVKRGGTKEPQSNLVEVSSHQA